MRFILSDPKKITSHGFSVKTEGLELGRFKANPVMLADHNTSLEHVIGRWDNLLISEEGLSAEPVFDLLDPKAASIAGKVERGFLRAASLGLYITQMEMDETTGGWTVLAAEVIEASIVSIPSDAGALVQLVHLYDRDRKPTSFEAVRLSLNSQKINNNYSQHEMERKQETVGVMLTHATLKALALDGDYTAKDVQQAVTEKDTEIERLKTKIADVEKDVHEQYLASAEREGKIDKAQMPVLLKLATANFDDVKAIVENNKPANKPVKLSSLVNSQADMQNDRTTWTWLDWTQKDPKGLQNLKASNPAQFSELKKTM